MLFALLLPAIFVAAFWALIVRPQQVRQRQHQAMVATLGVGDRVESFSGIQGTLAEVGEHTVGLEIAPGVVVTMAKLAVASRLDDEANEANEANEADEADEVEDQVSGADQPSEVDEGAAG